MKMYALWAKRSCENPTDFTILKVKATDPVENPIIAIGSTGIGKGATRTTLEINTRKIRKVGTRLLKPLAVLMYHSSQNV